MSRLLWTIEDIAKALKASDTTIWRLVGSCKIRFIWVGGCIRFPPEAIREWVTANTLLPHNKEAQALLAKWRPETHRAQKWAKPRFERSMS